MSNDHKAHEAFVAMQAELTNPPKTKQVSTGKFSYWYADLAEVTDHIRPVMAKHGFGFSQGPSVDPTVGPVYATRLYHRTGTLAVVEEKMPDIKDSKEQGAWVTYRRRFQLLAILGLTGDDDTDGDAPTQKRQETPSAAPPRPAVKPPAPTPSTTATALPTHVQALVDSAKAAKLKKADLEQLISLRYPDVPAVKELDQAQCKTLISDILRLPSMAPKSSEPPSSDTSKAMGG